MDTSALGHRNGGRTCASLSRNAVSRVRSGQQMASDGEQKQRKESIRKWCQQSQETTVFPWGDCEGVLIEGKLTGLPLSLKQASRNKTFCWFTDQNYQVTSFLTFRFGNVTTFIVHPKSVFSKGKLSCFQLILPSLPSFPWEYILESEPSLARRVKISQRTFFFWNT